MISFEEYRNLYHNGAKDEFEIKHLKTEFEEQVDLVNKLDKNCDYTKDELKNMLFEKSVDSQTTFYRKRRGLARIATIQGFDFRLIHQINSIEFADVFDANEFENEYFGSLDELFETVKLIQKISPENDRTGSLAVVGLLWSGLTFAEITRLMDCDIDFEKKTIDVVRKRRDGREKTETVAVCDRVLSAVKAYMDNRCSSVGWVFVGTKGDKAHKTTINKMITNLNGYTNKKFVSKNITYSGKFFRLSAGYNEKTITTKDIKIKYDNWISIFGK
ncbi:MAG: hypothetical protein J6T96_05460 [Bacteroidales bacterium]|nr:hypothetical protein [Bacteroidales bacterium]